MCKRSWKRLLYFRLSQLASPPKTATAKQWLTFCGIENTKDLGTFLYYFLFWLIFLMMGTIWWFWYRVPFWQVEWKHHLLRLYGYPEHLLSQQCIPISVHTLVIIHFSKSIQKAEVEVEMTWYLLVLGSQIQNQISEQQVNGVINIQDGSNVRPK